MKSLMCCKKVNILFGLIFIILLMAGCGKTDRVGDEMSGDSVYYLNREETKIVPVSLEKTEYDLSNLSLDEAVDEAVLALSAEPSDVKLKRTLGADTLLIDYSVNGGVLVLNFDSRYYELSKTKEVLFRAALVRTFCAINGIDSVNISVDGADLVDSTGRVVGTMVAETFIDNAGDEINAYEQTTLTLYFATSDGSHLSKESREVVYSSNISKEKLVLEQILAGPKTEGLTLTIAPERKVNSVTTKDGVCYVNLSDLSIDTLALHGPIAEEVSVYSIVNSLCELPNINRVQISIDGETDRLYRESLPLDKMYERNLDIVSEQ